MNDEILYASNEYFLKELYEQFCTHPEQLDHEWQRFFSSLQQDDEPEISPPSEKMLFQTLGAYGLIRGYRIRGHLLADLDPLKLVLPAGEEDLDPFHYGFTDEDKNTPIFIGGHLAGLKYATLNEILNILERAYCGTHAIEYMHIDKPDERRWLQERVEKREEEQSLSAEEKMDILHQLVKAETLEKVMQRRHPGSKRFGLEGAESFILAVNALLEKSAEQNIQEIVLGMAHRGRINALAHVVGSPLPVIFSRFQGGGFNQNREHATGDVLYHIGVSGDRDMKAGSLHVSLVANPSHLECVNPVVLGKVRARQRYYEREQGLDAAGSVMAVLIHGDAAYAGQGIVTETFDLSALDGYSVGGTIHIIINNQIGFTTAPAKARSSRYCSDRAKAVGAPIFHVNGDDPEAVARVMGLACDFREQFQKDVVIDLICYRRYGHSEIDDPTFTQPVMYNAIQNHDTAPDIYAKQLMVDDRLSEDDYSQLKQDIEQSYSDAYKESVHWKDEKEDWLQMYWSGLSPAEGASPSRETGVDKKMLQKLAKTIFAIPQDIHVHPKAKKLYEARLKSVQSGEAIDWGTAELLAFASLLDEGVPLRMSGEDSARGTFASRHAVLVDQKDGTSVMPLRNVRESVACDIIDSPLMEFGVLGFEYGYSLAEPHSLVIWEAQFGDFANGAQVIFDQFISSAEAKWLRMSGLVMFLPHGYDGQGPDHSSARLERYLQLCSADNIQVANCTSPANFFHLLRRQMRRPFRKPLVVMTPKSLLRHKECVSPLTAFGKGTSFHRILDDGHYKGKKSAEDVTKIIFCCGKIYYDLIATRKESAIKDCAIVRFEQLYPFPYVSLTNVLQRYPKAKDYVWCQEEPENMGAWQFMRIRLADCLKNGQDIICASRPKSASPAVAQKVRHDREQQEIVLTAFGLMEN